MRRNTPKTISIVGLGVVGLTTAVGFALKGHHVIGVDIDHDKVNMINDGLSPTYEEGLARTLKETRILATTDFESVLESDVSFLCGGTPGLPDGSLDLKYVKEPVEKLASVLRQKGETHLVVMRSTVVPGTTEKLVVPLFKDMPDVGVCVNPEFMREGTALEDFLNPSRVIIGEAETKGGDILVELYDGISSNIVRTNLRTAEMIKYASNTFLATKVSFINEIGNICKLLDIDIYRVAEGMAFDKRIGDEFLRAGIGFGGFCLPKDLAALAAEARNIGYEPRILQEVMQFNKEQPFRMIKLLKKHIPELRNRTIGILGLSFKPGTDDVRESIARPIIEALASSTV